MAKKQKSDLVELKEAYYSAGKRFAWPGSSPGLGIDMQLLAGDGILKVKVGDKPQIYLIEKNEARDFIEKYKSYYWARTKKLGVIAWHKFIKEIPNDAAPNQNPQTIQQRLI